MQQTMTAQQAANKAATMKSATELAAARAAKISKKLKGDGLEIEEKRNKIEIQLNNLKFDLAFLSREVRQPGKATIRSNLQDYYYGKELGYEVWGQFKLSGYENEAWLLHGE
ncbi:RNA recognition motif (RRM) containing protein [Arachis hypogaea]|nr:RNA recognition motif (RRM) containing protein [Arachis hypogaea]